MKDTTSPEFQLPNDSPEICILSPGLVPSSTCDDSTETTSQSFPKTVREKFYANIKTYEKNWSGECVLCGKTKYDNKGVTSNINRHVKSQHFKEYQEWISQLNDFNNKNQRKMPDLFIKNKEISRRSTSTKYSYHANHSRQMQLSQSIVENLIIDLGLPLSIVERQPFIEFMNIIDPKFTMTSRRTLSRTTIPHLYYLMNEQLKIFCHQSHFISLSLDIWTDRRLRAFFAMTGHAFVENTLKSYVLCFLHLSRSHTANLLLQTYENVINTFDIQAKVVRLVTDNASNNIKAFQNLIIPGFESYFEIENDDNDEIGSDIDLDEFCDDCDDEFSTSVLNNNDSHMMELIKHSFDNVAASNESLRIPCFAHTIQLVVNDGLKQVSSIQPALSKVSKIAKLSHTSTIFAEKLDRIEKSIPRANKTRWNSQFHTVENVLRIPSTELNEMLVLLKRKELCLLAKDYQMLNEFISLLTLFADATTITQSDTTPSVSFIAPTILAIYYDLLHEKSNISFTSSLCTTLLTSLVSRFGGLLEEFGVSIDKSIKQTSSSELYKDPIFILSPCLDGKFKLHWIIESSLSSEVKTTICEKIKKMIYDHCVVLHHDNNSTTTTCQIDGNDDEQSTSSKTTTTPTTTAPKSSTPKRKSLFSNIERKTIKKRKVDTFTFIKDEVDRYLSDDETDSNRFFLIDEPIKYKSLHQLAKKIFTVPATSCSVERVFSQSGFLLRQHRARMSRKTLQMLTMLKCNQGLM